MNHVETKQFAYSEKIYIREKKKFQAFMTIDNISALYAY